MNQNGELLLQKRAACKKQEPNLWALTAGHVDSKEEEKHAMAREISEEVGLELAEEELEFMCIEKIKHDTNYAFVYFYFVCTDKKIEEYKMQEEEVSQLRYVSIEELKEIASRKDEQYNFSTWEGLDKMIQMLENK